MTAIGLAMISGGPEIWGDLTVIINIIIYVNYYRAVILVCSSTSTLAKLIGFF
jgi:putative Ca2+/H+ antiporter (TMEM165/GDT1 family)